MDEELKLALETMRRENAAGHDETRRYITVVAERLESKIQLVAEGVVATHERIDRLEVRMHEEFDGVRSMIKFSHH